MTTIVLLLGGILVVGLALAVELLRLSRATSHYANPARLQRELSSPAAYQPMSRLFLPQDFEFLASLESGRGMRGRLRRSRAAVMTLYLHQLRDDFHRVWAPCRLLARSSHDSELSILLIRQFAVFHALYLVLRMRCLTGWYGFVEFDIATLVSVLNQIRSRANRALQTTRVLTLEPAGF